ncbi:MAG: YvcK family protein [bacterium]|nr:YvcK family protein [bacterium]
MNNKTLVAIGGGNGTTQVILSSRPYFKELAAVVGVTDFGRSTGVARAIGKIPAPGDIRNTIANLALNPDEPIVKLLQHRFGGDAIPQLEGMAVGNLLLAALSQMSGSFSESVLELQHLVGCMAEILPVSDMNVDLCAELEDGTITHNELETRGTNKSPIKRLFLSKSPAPALNLVLEKIKQADLVVIGPGSFYTSIVATLVFEGMKEALKECKGNVIYICNTTTQPGQADSFTATDYITKMCRFLGDGVVDYALVSKNVTISREVLQKYAADGIRVLQPDATEVAHFLALPCKVIYEDFAENPQDKREIWNKLDTIRHDHEKLGKVLNSLIKL